MRVLSSPGGSNTNKSGLCLRVWTMRRDMKPVQEGGTD